MLAQKCTKVQVHSKPNKQVCHFVRLSKSTVGLNNRLCMWVHLVFYAHLSEQYRVRDLSYPSCAPASNASI